VNFPRCGLDRRVPHRLLVANRNIPNMVGQITTLLAGADINIADLINHNRGELAYNIIDTEQEIPDDVLARLKNINGVIRFRRAQTA
jgi:D-3-phosphoglycerate dehydrogenase